MSTDFRGSTDQGEAMAIQPDGNVIMAGGSSTVGSNGSTELALARYHLASTATKTIGVTTSGLSISGPAQIQSGLAYTLTLHDELGSLRSSRGRSTGAMGKHQGRMKARRLSRTDFLRTEISLSAPPRSPTGATILRCARWQWRSPRQQVRGSPERNSVSDGQNYTLQLTAQPAANVAKWQIDWGDGTAQLANNPATNTLAVTHTFGNATDVTVKVSALDIGNNLVGYGEKFIQGVNVPPDVNASANFTVETGAILGWTWRLSTIRAAPDRCRKLITPASIGATARQRPSRRSKKITAPANR